MKVLVVIAAFLAMVGVGVFASASKRYQKWLMIALALPMLKWPSFSLMLFSAETYRGSTRGMEVSLPYLLSFAMMVALLIRGKAGKLLADGGSILFLLYWLLQLPSLSNCEQVAEPGLLYAWFEIWKVPMMFLIYRAVRGYCLASENYEAPLLGLGVVVFFNFLEVLKQHFIIHVSQAWGVFTHQNCMATWALVMSSVYFAAYLNLPNSRYRKFYVALFVMATASCLRTYSRGSMTMMPLSFGIIALISFVRNFNFRIMRRLMPLFILGALGLLLALPKIIQRFDHASSRSGRMRVVFAEAAMRMVKEHPWAGIGLNNWGIKINPPWEYSQHREEFGMPPDFKDGIVETIYLLTWAECGTPCLLALLGLFGWHWLKAIQLTGRLRGKPEFFIPCGLVGGLTGLYLQSCLEWVLKQSVNFCQLCIFFGILAALNAKYSGKGKHRSQPALKPAVASSAAKLAAPTTSTSETSAP